MHIEAQRRFPRSDGDDEESWVPICPAPCPGFRAYTRGKYRVVQQDQTRSDELEFDRDLLSADLYLRRGHRLHLPAGLISLSLGGTALLALGFSGSWTWIDDLGGKGGQVPVGAIAFGLTLGLGIASTGYGIVGTVLGRTGTSLRNLRTLATP